MGRQLREIVRRRAELVSRAGNERMELTENKLWSSSAVAIAGHLMDLGCILGARSSIIFFAGSILFTGWPGATLKWAGRGLSAWMLINKIRKKFIR
jgi:hypothetical protein